MTHDQASRIARDPSSDPFDRYEAHKVLSTPEPLPKPASERGLDTAPVDWSRIIDQRLAMERERTSALLIEVVAQLRHDAADEIERACRPLNAEIAELRATLAELRLVLASDRARSLAAPQVAAHLN